MASPAFRRFCWGRTPAAGCGSTACRSATSCQCFIDSVKSVSRGVTRLSVNSRKQLRRVNRPVHIQVFVTPGSEVSAGMALLAHAMAVESRHIIADVIEAEEFPDLVRRYGVRQVPLTIINEFSTVSGMVGEEEFMEKVVAGWRSAAAGVLTGTA